MKKEFRSAASTLPICIGIIASVVSNFYWTGGSDPVNLPKFFALTTFVFGLVGYFLSFGLSAVKEIHIALRIFALVFIGALCIPMIFTSSPITHQLFGVGGRNTGLVTYTALCLIMLIASTLRDESRNKIVVSLLISGAITIVISLLELLGANPLNTTGTFQALIGPFGNPNFVSAFMGIIGASSLVLICQPKVSKSTLIFTIPILFLSILINFNAQAKQGIVVLVFGGLLTVLFRLHLVVKKNWLTLLFLSGSFAFGILSLFGLQNRGPVSSLIYKSSVSFREEYWAAGINMLRKFPSTGVGLSSYGDWYRELRNPSALINPGSEVTTNVSHNVFIDFGANGGWPLLLSTVTIFVFALSVGIKYLIHLKTYDGTFLVIFVAWLSYVLQSMVSIDQIGLAVWGWVLTGALLSYIKVIPANDETLASKKKSQELKRQKQKSKVSIGQISLTISGLLVGLIVAFPSFNADLHWAQALRAGNSTLLKSAAVAWPLDELRVGNAAYIYMQNKMYPQAKEMLDLGIQKFPRSFSTWRLYYQLPIATSEEKAIALAQMRALDPYNDSLKGLK